MQTQNGNVVYLVPVLILIHERIDGLAGESYERVIVCSSLLIHQRL